MGTGTQEGKYSNSLARFIHSSGLPDMKNWQNKPRPLFALPHTSGQIYTPPARVMG